MLYKNSILITSPSIKKKVQIIAFDIDGKKKQNKPIKTEPSLGSRCESSPALPGPALLQWRDTVPSCACTT